MPRIPRSIWVLLMLAVAAVVVPAGARGLIAPVGEAAGICDPIDPRACLLPWPNDYFTVADPTTDTGRRLNLNLVAMPRNIAGVPIDPSDFNRNDGFSPGALIVTKVHGLDTPAALAKTNPVGLTDLGRYADPAAPVVVIDAATKQRHPIWVELDRSESLVGKPPPAFDTTLLIRPAVNFAEGHRYIVALRFLKDASGDTLSAGHAFAAFKKGAGEAGRQPHMNEIFSALEQAGIARGDLYLAWDFTVAS
ncbi:MAG: hypothetical protein ACRDKS_00295 [Actinomycetota bacterium]